MLQGSIVALVTPFKKNGDVNFDKLEGLIDFHIKNNTSGILILGTTGEGSTLSFAEKEKITKFAAEKIAGKIPLIVGIGSNDTEHAKTLARVLSTYADYTLSITPYYNKANSEGLRRHFYEIANASKCPVILYNVPSRTGMSIPLDILKKLSVHPNICGIKEASGDLGYASNVAKLVSDSFALYSGNDDMIVPLMSLGASGVISVLANIAPNCVAEIVENCRSQNYPVASKMQLEVLNLIKLLFSEVNPIPIKEAMNFLGYDVGNFRLPLYRMSRKNKLKLIEELKNLEGVLR